MKYRLNKKYIYLTLSLLIALCGAIAFYYLIFHADLWQKGIDNIVRVSMPIIDGFIVAYLLNPCVNWLEKRLFHPILTKMKIDVNKLKIKKRIRIGAIIITMTLFGLLIYFIMLMLIPQLIESISSLVTQLPSYASNLSDRLSKLLEDYPEIEKTINDYLDDTAVDLTKWVTGKVLPSMNSFVSTVTVQIFGVLRFVLNFLLGLIISVYMLNSKEVFAAQLKKLLYTFASEKRANNILDEIRFIHTTFGGFITGKLIDSFIIGCLCFMGTSILQTPYAVLISVIIGVTNIIPFFGPFLGAIPSAFIILMVDPKQCLYFLIFVLILQQLDGNVIGPKILGNSTGLSSFWVIFSITIFGGLFGVLGMFIGIPVFAVIYSAIKRYSGRVLKRKNLPESTLAYMKLKHIEDGKMILSNNPYVQEEEEATPIKIMVSSEQPDSIVLTIPKEEEEKYVPSDGDTIETMEQFEDELSLEVIESLLNPENSVDEEDKENSSISVENDEKKHSSDK